MNPLRGLIDRALYRERQHVADRPLSIDATSLPLDLDLPSRPFKAGEIKPVATWHVTDVFGGFGVADYQIAAAKKLIEQGRVSPELAALGAYGLALVVRYHAAAYHGVASRRVGVVRNHPLSLRTSHGNGGNMGIGLAVDCANEEKNLPDALVDASIAMGVDRITELHQATGEVVVSVGHRAWSDDRLDDPDAVVWRLIVIPVVESLGSKVAVIGYNTRASSGRPVPNTWDPRALYDAKGRPLPKRG